MKNITDETLKTWIKQLHAVAGAVPSGENIGCYLTDVGVINPLRAAAKVIQQELDVRKVIRKRALDAAKLEREWHS